MNKKNVQNVGIEKEVETFGQNISMVKIANVQARERMTKISALLDKIDENLSALDKELNQ